MNHELIAEYLKQIDLAENEHSPWRRRDYADGLVDILRDIFTDDELIELAQAKAEGRLVVLPCKVGDTVYEITREDCDYEDCPDEYHDRVDEVYIDQITCEIFENEVEIKLNDYLDIKDAYPTYEAAEKVIPTCNVTKLPCAGCNPCCEHREE